MSCVYQHIIFEGTFWVEPVQKNEFESMCKDAIKRINSEISGISFKDVVKNNFEMEDFLVTYQGKQYIKIRVQGEGEAAVEDYDDFYDDPDDVHVFISFCLEDAGFEVLIEEESENCFVQDSLR